MPKPLHKIYLLFAVCALLIALLLSAIVYKKLLPYRLSLLGKKVVNTDQLAHFIFYDLDHDGFQERIEMIKEPINQFYYIKIYQDYNRGLIDQFNFSNEIIFKSPIFYDLNQDGWDEMLVFSNDNGSLYLSILDVKHTKFLQREKSLLAASKNRRGNKWDIASIEAQFVQLTPDSPQQLLFAVNTGYARLPRCLCLYDLAKQKIIKRFDYHLGRVQLMVTDLNRDGFKEILLGAAATNNFSAEVSLSDAYSWFLMLDHNCNFMKPPIKLGGKFSYVYLKKLELDEQNLILLVHRNDKNKNLLTIMDSSLKIIVSKNLEKPHRGVIFAKQSHPPQIFVITYDGDINVYDINLNLLGKKVLSDINKNGYFLKAENVVGDENPEYLLYDHKNIFLYDHNWQILARYPYSNNILETYVVRQPDRDLPGLVCANPKGSIHLEVSPVNLYGKIPILFVIFLLSAFIFLSTAYWTVEKIRQYMFAFFFLLRQSDNAIILLNYKGRVISVNKKVNRFLRLDTPLRKGASFEQGFEQRPEMVRLIKMAMVQAKQLSSEISFEDSLHSFIGSVTITPLFSLFKFVFAYLIEIKDSTEQVLLERQRNWQRNVRKMVHDIKTPIAGVQLKLQMLYQKLAEKNCQNQEEICQELEEAHAELKRIRNIAQEFMKLSDLEKLNVSEIELCNLIMHSVAPFEFFKNEQLKIEFTIDPNLPEHVYWDERQIELLLHILIENAIDALQGKGTINIRVKPADHARNFKQPWIEFRILDDGSGIPKEIKDKIFEPHFSTKAEGSGMGLAFAKHIVLQHQGEIEVISEKNEGTLFIVRLPVKITGNE